jgi:hypothetical protein
MPAFSPRIRAGAPRVALVEAGTGTGKTLGYLAPASVWADRLLVEAKRLDARRQGEAVEAGAGLAGRAGGHVVDQNRTELTAFGIDGECPPTVLAARTGHLGDKAAQNAAVAAEGDQIELHALDRMGLFSITKFRRQRLSAFSMLRSMSAVVRREADGTSTCRTTSARSTPRM